MIGFRGVEMETNDRTRSCYTALLGKRILCRVAVFTERKETTISKEEEYRTAVPFVISWKSTIGD